MNGRNRADGTNELEERLNQYIVSERNKAVSDLANDEQISAEVLNLYIKEYDYLQKEQPEIIQKALKEKHLGLIKTRKALTRIMERLRSIISYSIMKLGKLEQITDLRSVWKHEAKDFTPWLAKEENLEILSEAVGIDIVVEEQESNVGDFSVDLFATEEGTGRRIIIENQLEETNHDHLGKIITYASGKEAEVIIWIVRKARDEHKQAIEWLNQHTDDKFEFFLIEIELWKINDSEPAPKFNIVERPNTWAKAMKKTAALSETENLKLAFWEKFNNEAPKHSAFIREFKLRKPQAQHWYDLGLGSSAYHLCMT